MRARSRIAILPAPFFLLGLTLFPGGAPAAAPRGDEEARELVAFTRAYRLAEAESLRVALAAGLTARLETLAPHARDRVAILRDRRLDPALPIEDLALTAAHLHGLAAELDPADTLARAELSAAAAAATQECLARLREGPSPWGLSVDSLRALVDPARTAATLAPELAAPLPPPWAPRPKKVLLERGERFDLTPDGRGVDWFAWAPGVDVLLFRAGDDLFAAAPAGIADTLGFAGGPGSPVPAVSPSGEYVAAAGPGGGVRILRRGTLAAPWRALEPDVRPSALAFSPAALELAVADSAGAILLYDLGAASWRPAARAEGIVTALHWSPRGDLLAWDVVADRGRPEYAGAVAIHGRIQPPPPPRGAGIDLLGAPQWAPDGVSFLAPGRRGADEGIWLWSDSRIVAVRRARLDPPAVASTSPDFGRIAMSGDADPRPGPWGFTWETPFARRLRTWTTLDVTWEAAPGATLVLDRPAETSDAVAWDFRGDWYVRPAAMEDGIAVAEPVASPRAGLEAADLRIGETVPLCGPGGTPVRPALSSRQGWLAWIEADGEGVAAGRLLVREITFADANPRDAERLHLRSLPLFTMGRNDEAFATLRDAVRLDPDAMGPRRLVAEKLAEAAAKSSGAAAGVLLAGAAREFGRLHAVEPGHPRYGSEFARTFVACAVMAGRVYAAEAARRGLAFLESDPGATADPERVRTVLLPTLVDACLWDPGRPEALALVAGALRHYRGR